MFNFVFLPPFRWKRLALQDRKPCHQVQKLMKEIILERQWAL